MMKETHAKRTTNQGLELTICVLLPLITRLSNTSEVLVAAIAANELLGYKFCTTNSGFLTIFKLTKYCEVLEAIDLS